VLDEGTAEPRLKEPAYLKTSIVNGCQYCTNAHTASAKRVGITEQQIQEVFFYERSQAFDEKEKATLLFAEQVTRGAATLQPTLELLGKFSPRTRLSSLRW
jgi:AhpD family alkylhydroperoxidase